MYVIMGSTIDGVVKTYHEIVGRPVLVPLFAFGYHQCKWGYETISDLTEVYSQAWSNSFPLDGLWTDIDLMKNYTNFSLDESRYPGLSEFIEQTLHNEGIHFIPIVDAAIKIDYNDDLFLQGIASSSFIFSGYTKQALAGLGWPGNVVFVNHMPNMSGNDLWNQELASFRS